MSTQKKKDRKKSKKVKARVKPNIDKRDRLPGSSTPQLNASTPIVEGETPALLADTQDQPAETPKVESDGQREDEPGDDVCGKGEGGRKVIAWLGPTVPHSCPHCGISLLQDRSTKACLVMKKSPEVTENGRTFTDRDMKCLHCRSPFIARVYTESEKKSDI